MSPFSIFYNKMHAKIFVLLFFIILWTGSELQAAPVFHCPEDITISCCTDYKNTGITGHPADFNQGYQHFSFEDEVYLNECREGYVIRHWTGYVGTTAYTCEQRITMEYGDPFNGTIIWPPDWQGKCGDEIPFIEPDYDRGFCDQVAHTYNDDTLRFVGNVCMKILRNWKVVDWCKYQPNSGSGIGMWKHTQVLKIVETSKPQFGECSDWEVKAENNDCTADVVLTKSASDENCNFTPVLNWRIEFDRFNDWSVDSIADMSGDTVRFTLEGLPVGEHRITWKVSDRCGNVQLCSELIRVEDGKAPTPFCYLSMPLVLMPGANMLEVRADHFIKDARDNCSDRSAIRFSWTLDPADSIRVFDCSDIGFQFIPVYAFDESGNFDFCFIFTRVTAHGNCTNGLSDNLVQGRILDFAGHPVPGIRLGLGTGSHLVHPVDTTTTEGLFRFRYNETIAEPAMYFSSGSIDLQGITTLDLVLFMKYLLGLAEPMDPELFHATADIDGNGVVNSADLLLLRDLILGLPVDENIPYQPLRVFIPDPDQEGEFLEVDSVKDFSNHSTIRVIQSGDIDRLFVR
jgi:hypothetical protein